MKKENYEDNFDMLMNAMVVRESEMIEKLDSMFVSIIYYQGLYSVLNWKVSFRIA